VLAGALLGGYLRPSATDLEVAGQRAHPLLGPLVVGEHRRLERKLDELADAADNRLGAGDQPLIATLGVASDAPRLAACAPDLRGPPNRRVLDCARPPADLEQRQGDIATVANDVDERGLRESSRDPLHRLQILRGLLAPTGL